MINTSIIYDHRGRADKNGLGPVEIRIIVDRRPYYVNTGIRVLKSNFVGGTITGRHDAKELNDRLRILYNKVLAEVNECLEKNKPLDVAYVRKKIWQADEELQGQSTALTDFVEEQESLMQLKPGTLKHYRTLRMRMIEYGITRWSDLTTENLCKFDAWLHGIKVPLSDAERKSGKEPQLISDGGVYTYHKCLKAILNRAVLFGKLDVNPYTYLRGKFKRGDKLNVEYLTQDEMDAIESLHPVPGSIMAVARDLFVFQMHTGLSFADLCAFDFSQYRLVDGKWQTIGTRVKTGVQYCAQLTDECVRILEQYNWQLPGGHRHGPSSVASS